MLHFVSSRSRRNYQCCLSSHKTVRRCYCRLSLEGFTLLCFLVVRIAAYSLLSWIDNLDSLLFSRFFFSIELLCFLQQTNAIFYFLPIFVTQLKRFISHLSLFFFYYYFDLRIFHTSLFQFVVTFVSATRSTLQAEISAFPLLLTIFISIYS